MGTSVNGIFMHDFEIVRASINLYKYKSDNKRFS